MSICIEMDWTGHKKKVCLEQNISIGSIHASFHNFHNVSTEVKSPQKLVMLKVIYIYQIWLTYREKSDIMNSGNIANVKGRCSLELRGTWALVYLLGPFFFHFHAGFNKNIENQ